MMREDESFDKLVREKLQQRSFNPSKERRAKAEQAINARNARKLFRFRVNAALGVGFVSGIVLLGTYFFAGKNTAENSSSLKPIHKTVLTQNSVTKETSDNPQNKSFTDSQNNSQKNSEINSSGENSVNNNSSANGIVSADNHSSSNNNTNQKHSNSGENNSGNKNKSSAVQNTTANNDSKKTADVQKSNKNKAAGQKSKSSNGKNSDHINSANSNPENEMNSDSHTATAKNNSGSNSKKSQKTNSGNSDSRKETNSSSTATAKNNSGNNPKKSQNTNSENSDSGNGMNSDSHSETAKNNSDNNSQNSQGTNTVNSDSANKTNSDSQIIATKNNETQDQSKISDAGTAVNNSSKTVNESAIKDSTENAAAKSALAAQTNHSSEQQKLHSDSVKTALRAQEVADSIADASKNSVAAHNHAGSVNYFFAEGGMTFIPGFSHGYNSGRSLNPVVGGGFCFRIGMKLSAEAALHYTFIGHASDSSITYTNTSYNFGAQYEYTDVSLKRLHYFSMPLSISWHASSKNAFNGGLMFNYLFTTETRFHTYSASQSNIHSYSKYGYIQGVNRFDVLLNAGYTRSFGPDWSMRIAAYYGLMDIKKNSWYGINKFERNKGLQFTIQYAF